MLAAVTMSAVERPHLDPSARVIVAALLVGLLATAFAMSTLAWALQHTTATRGSVICSAEPVRAERRWRPRDARVLLAQPCVALPACAGVT